MPGGPRVRFYADAPLILDDGSCIGSFCVIDTRPRELGPADLATLRDLRDLALEEIQRTRAWHGFASRMRSMQNGSLI